MTTLKQESDWILLAWFLDSESSCQILVYRARGSEEWDEIPKEDEEAYERY